MSRSAVNFLWDAWSLLVLLAVVWTRLVTAVIVRPAGADRQPVTLWGWSWSHWDRLNLLLTALFAISILVHLILHWTWVTQFVHQRYRRWRGGGGPLNSGLQTVYGVGFLIVVLSLLGGLLAVAAVMAKPA